MSKKPTKKDISPQEIQNKIVDTVRTLIELASNLIALHRTLDMCKTIECPEDVLESIDKIVETVRKIVTKASEEAKQVQA